MTMDMGGGVGGPMPKKEVERESVAKMAGELLREFGVLYLTFGVLDSQVAAAEHRGGFGAEWFVHLAVVGIVFIGIGMAAERLRTR